MGNWDVSKPNNDGERELLDRAVKALETEFATKTCNKQIASKLVASEDCISRRAVHEAITRWAGSMSVLIALPTREVRPLLDSIHELPSVTPKQRTGHWILVSDGTPGGYWKCSECLMHKRMPGRLDSFCSCCGADMQESEE